MPFTHDTRRIPGSMRPDLTSAPLPTSYTTRGVWVSEATVLRRRSGGAPKMAPRGRGGGAQLPRWGRTELVCASVLFPHQSVPYRALLTASTTRRRDLHPAGVAFGDGNPPIPTLFPSGLWAANGVNSGGIRGGM